MLPISVVIPIYNHEIYIQKCLRSILLGTLPEEVILVDNASTDGSVVAAEAVGLPNLVVIRNDRNVGATKARQIAMEQARCELFCFLDSDDWLGPKALDLGFAKLRESDLDAALFTMFRVANDEETVLFSLEPPKMPVSGQQAFEMTLGEWQIDTRGVYKTPLYHRAFEKLELTGHSDDEVLSRLALLEADRIGGTSGAYNYRVVEKPPTFEMIVGQARTNLRTLEIAAARAERFARDEPLRAMRNVVTRNLLGLAARELRRGGDFTRLKELYGAYRRLGVRWKREDLKFLTMDRLLAAILAGSTIIPRLPGLKR